MTAEEEREKEAIERLEEFWSDSWLVTDRRPPWQWLEDNVHKISYSPIPGSFRSENSPWIREPLEEMAKTETQLISIIAAIQACKTLFAELSSCWIAENAPGPTLWLDQTDADAKDQCGNRLQEIWKGCPPVARLVSKDANKTKLDAVRFLNGMPLWIKGAHSKTNLQRRSIRWLFGDETWRWPQGHMAEAEARVTAFGWLGKRIFFSQAGEPDDDTDRKHKETDMREWSWRCQNDKCGSIRPWLLSDMDWCKTAKNSDGTWNYEKARNTTTMRCPDCGETYADTDRNRRILNDPKNGARYVAKNPNAPKGNVGFHWNGFCAGSWGKLVELYLRAKAAIRQGDTEPMKIFYQKRLALPFEEYDEDFKMEIAASGYSPEDKWELAGAFNRKGKIVPLVELEEENETLRERWEREALEGSPPNRIAGLLRFISVDCQMDHFYALVREWSPGGSSRLLKWVKVQSFDEIEDLQEEWDVLPRLVFVDSGYESWTMYRECAERGWTSLRGDKKERWTHRIKRRNRSGKIERVAVERFYSPERRIPIGGKVCRLHYYSNLSCKDVLNKLRRNQNPERGATWDVYDGVEDEYLKQMESETRILKNGKWIWEPVTEHADNHLWDCEVENVVGALMTKIVGKESLDTEDEGEGDDEG